MLIIKSLKLLGYEFFTNGEKITYKHFGQPPPVEQVKFLFEEVKKNKPAAIAYLQQEKRRTANRGKREVIF